jgi:hypothetical protein
MYFLAGGCECFVPRFLQDADSTNVAFKFGKYDATVLVGQG